MRCCQRMTSYACKPGFEADVAHMTHQIARATSHVRRRQQASAIGAEREIERCARIVPLQHVDEPRDAFAHPAQRLHVDLQGKLHALTNPSLAKGAILP